MPVPIAGETPLVITDQKTPRIVRNTRESVLLRNDEHLEGVPAKWLYLSDGGVHVLVDVESHHGIDLQHNASLFALLTQTLDRLDIGADPSADLSVRRLVQRATGDGHNIQIFAVLDEPFL